MDQNGGNSIYRLISSVVVFFLCVSLLVAQDLPDTSMVRYSPGYKFRDGIYINKEMVRNNRPIPPARIVSTADRFDDEFYNDLLKLEYVVLYDNNGVRAYIRSGELWGYACKGVLYIQVGHRFHRLTLEGNISRFMAAATTYEKVPYSATDFNGYVPTYYTNPGWWNRYRVTTQERKVYLLDLETNSLKDYTPDNLGELLRRDAQLYAEFSALKRGERKKRLLEFIQRYNQRNPLWLPQ